MEKEIKKQQTQEPDEIISDEDKLALEEIQTYLRPELEQDPKTGRVKILFDVKGLKRLKDSDKETCFLANDLVGTKIILESRTKDIDALTDLATKKLKEISGISPEKLFKA
jgi:hypothetical protein